MKLRSFLTLLMTATIIGCQQEGEVFPTTGKIQFSMSKSETPEGRVSETLIPVAVLVSIADAQNNPVEQNKKIALYSFGNSFVSESLQLMTGHYKLTQFVVLGANDKVIYATPVEGSDLAQLVNDPLPIDFNVTENESTLVSPQVLAVTDNNTPENFGYVSFGFEVVSPPVGKIKEIIVDEGYNSINKSLFYYSGELLSKTESYYCYNGCSLLDSTVYTYNSGGFIESTIRYNVFYPSAPPVTTSFEFQNGLLKKRWYTGDINSNDYEYEYYYDADGTPSHCVQRMKYSTGYKDFRYFEYVVDDKKDITSISIYNINVYGEKSTIKFKFDLVYSETINPYSIACSEYTSSWFFAPYTRHAILSNKLTGYTNSGGVVIESSSCTFSASYENNVMGLPIRETISNPDGCTLGEYDGTVKTFIYH